MPALPRPPVWLAVLLAPAAVDAIAIVLTVALALSLGRDPNLETTFALVPDARWRGSCWGWRTPTR